MTNNNNDESVDLTQEKEWYKDLLKDSNLEKLEAELYKPNLFGILGIGRSEIRHSNFLGWLLDPNESHGLGNRFLIRLLRDFSTEKEKSLHVVDINKLNFSNVVVKREDSYSCQEKGKGSIDILINFKDDKLVVCIENKIDTIDSKGQLKKYEELINDTYDGYRTVFIYLTPWGDTPKNYDGSGWQTYSYEKIIAQLESIQDVVNDLTIKTYISDYLTILNREIMGTNDHATELANAIYEQHKPIIDFINEYRDSSREYQLYWEKEHPWMVKSLDSIIALVKDVDGDKNKYSFGFVKNYISLKRNSKVIYEFYSPTNGKQFSVQFNFSKEEKETQIREDVDALLKELRGQKTISSKCDKDARYFVITRVKEIVDDHEDIIKHIHKLRFEITD